MLHSQNQLTMVIATRCHKRKTRCHKRKGKATFLEVMKEVDHLFAQNWQVEKHRIAIERLIALQVQHMVLIAVALFYLFFNFHEEIKKMCATDPCTLWLYAHVLALLSFILLLFGIEYLLRTYCGGILPSKETQNYLEFPFLKKIEKHYNDHGRESLLSGITKTYVEVVDVGKDLNEKKTEGLYDCRKYFAFSFGLLILYAIAYVAFFILYKF